MAEDQPRQGEVPRLIQRIRKTSFWDVFQAEVDHGVVQAIFGLFAIAMFLFGMFLCVTLIKLTWTIWFL